MKKIFLLIFVLSLTTSFAQQKNKNLTPFVGNWQFKQAEKTFKIKIYAEYGMLKGDYELVDNQGNTLYKSNKLVDEFFDIYFGHAINGSSKNGKNFSGIIKDNVLFGDGVHDVKTGSLTLSLSSNNTILNWKLVNVEINTNRKNKIVPQAFTIPTKMTLSKIK